MDGRSPRAPLPEHLHAYAAAHAAAGARIATAVPQPSSQYTLMAWLTNQVAPIASSRLVLQVRLVMSGGAYRADEAVSALMRRAEARVFRA